MVFIGSKTMITELSLQQLDDILPIEQACHSHPTSKANLATCFSARYHNFKLVIDDKVVGFYIAELVLDELTLHDICIAPECQGRGFGKQLLLHFIDLANQLNAIQLWLEVRESNVAAISLYEAHGFVETGKRRGYYPAKNGREDALLMGCTLSLF